MLNPLSNVKIPAQVTGADPNGNGKQVKQNPADGKNQPRGALPEPTSSGDDSLKVSQDGATLNASGNSRPASAAINSYEEASSLVTKIKQQFEESGAQALMTHSQPLPDRVSRLLFSTP
ncbi:MAG: hypothetical protein GY703_09460 [Gammaproteobacteria bacterium]|nr:hypothetical protein [Gammaproteobacteria bacterium]